MTFLYYLILLIIFYRKESHDKLVIYTLRELRTRHLHWCYRFQLNMANIVCRRAVKMRFIEKLRKVQMYLTSSTAQRGKFIPTGEWSVKYCVEMCD